MINKFVNNIKKNRFFNHLIIVLTLLIILILAYTTYYIYYLTLEEAKKSHQEKQLELAKSATSGISNFLGFLEHELKYYSDKQYFDQYYKTRTDYSVLSAIFIIEESGNILFEEGVSIPQVIRNEFAKKISNLRDVNNNDPFYLKVCSSPIDQNSDSLFFALVIKMHENVSKNGNLYLGFLISFDWLINNYVEPLKLTENDFAWILDDQGRLIYHPNHKEMLFRTISDHDESCRKCHSSFEVQNLMLIKRTSLNEYKISDEPKKIMAYTRIELNENFWILAISTNLPSVISNVQSNFKLFFVLSGIAVTLIIFMGSVLFSINIKKIKAEESERLVEQSRVFQEKINHAAKLASIGELVDNVAHEINTPTGIISAETDVLFLQKCDPKNCCEELEIIKEQTKRIRNYTRSLLNYSKRMPFLPGLNDVNELIEECIFLLSPRIRANQINITKNISSDIPKLKFDKGRIEQVIINILNNSIDASVHNKEINISVTCDNYQNIDEYLTIAISDKGSGIKQEDMKNIFDPFFSTKPTDQGTGLGLSISNAIIKRHNGKISVESEKDRGTTFFINLPINNTFGD